MNTMVTDCECLTVKKYDDEWRCLICWKLYAPKPEVRRAPRSSPRPYKRCNCPLCRDNRTWHQRQIKAPADLDLDEVRGERVAPGP